MGELRLNRGIRLGNPLRAASLVETLVASVFFLAVFCICLETLSRLVVSNNGPGIYTAMDNAVQACERQCIDQQPKPGTTHTEHPWGELILQVNSYRDTPDLQEIVITARAQRNRKRIELRRIVYHAQLENNE